MNFVRGDGRMRRSRVRRHARSRVCVWMCALEHSLSARGGTGQQTEREARGGAHRSRSGARDHTTCSPRARELQGHTGVK